MDYAAAIKRVYEHLEADNVEKATMECLRIARHCQDYLYVAVFLRETYFDGNDFSRVLADDTAHLKESAFKLLCDTSHAYWLDNHNLEFSLGQDERGHELTILLLGVGDLDTHLAQCEQSIHDLTVPSGMSPYDTAAFTAQFYKQKARIRLRIRAIQFVKGRIKARCMNYAIRIERQLESQRKTQSFLEQVQNQVNNFFKARSEDIYVKLQKAAQLVDSDSAEDMSLLLTQVRRVVKSVADYFYPPSEGPIICADGKERVLGEEQYLNRLNEFLVTHLEKSSSRDLLRAEFERLAVFARRLNDVASKGVHAAVSASEAKQGLLGIYLFLYNVCSRLEEK